ncbi:MAG: apolipoprotein N-acyltransferase [Saprospiraceae bacterium]
MSTVAHEAKSSVLPRIAAILFFALLCAFAGWRMLQLPLWGWWPLVFNMALWFTLVSIFYPKDANKRKWLGAATLSGILLGIGFPPSPFTWVVIFAWIPLLAVENGIYQRQEKTRPGQVLLFSWHAFVIWNIIGTFWVTNTAFIAGLFANFINALMMACPMMLIHVIGRRLSYRLLPFVFIAFWISFEYLHHEWDLSWPWLTMGNAMAEYPWAIQWYEYTGIFGGSLWILGLNAIGYSIITGWLKAKNIRPRFFAFGVLLLIPVLVSILIWNTTKPGNAEPVSVIIVQPNFEPHYEKFDIPQREQIARFIELSRKLLDSNVHYIVFPETSFEGILLNKFRENEVIAIFQNLIDQYPDLHLVEGITSYRILTEDQLEVSSYRTHTDRQGNITYLDVQNSAVQLSSGKQTFQVYFKSKFVPGPEIFPFKKYLFFLRPVIDKLGGSVEGLSSQKERGVFDGGPLKVAPVICYESIYGEFTAGYVRNGATVFFIVTNDGWWDNTPGHIQHMKLGALRAIEHRRPIARSANTGISSFIDIKGRIVQPTKYGEATAIKGDIIPETLITFYTRCGDIIAKIAVLGTIVFFILVIFVTIRRRKKSIQN